jgi:hypothetical protein
MPKRLKSISFFALPQNVTIALGGLAGNEGTAGKTQQALQSGNSALKNFGKKTICHINVGPLASLIG